MFCSTIIPTIGRPSLDRAVNSVLEQAFTADEFEVIVVNDSGRPLPDAVWQQSDQVQIIHTNRRERSVARNTGAAISKGKYLHFLDDDDWIVPGALESLWTLSQQADDTAWLYGGSQLVDRDGKSLIQLHHGLNGNCFVHIMAGEWIPLQSSLIRAEAFFAIGGFHPLILGNEDFDLGRRIALRGDLISVSAIIACIGMGEEGSSTDHSRLLGYGRWGRELVLSESGAFARLRASANDSYWHGRVVRVYLTSMVWNLYHHNIFATVSRSLFGVVGLVLTGWHILSIDFWHALTKPYTNRTFLRGFREMTSSL